MKPAFGLHEEKAAARARQAFREVRTLNEEAIREAEIAVMPVVEWRGKVLRTIRCCGETGKGPHVVNVPESVLWSLIDVERFRCPFHR